MAVPVLNGTVAASSGFPQPNLSWSTSHTINAGLTDSILVILATAQSARATSAGWNGVLMPNVGIWTTAAYPMTAFWMLNPASGTHTAGVTWEFTDPAVSMACLTFTGVSGVRFSASDTNTTTSTGVSVTFPTYGVDTLAVSMCSSGNEFGGVVHTEGSGQTQTSDINAGHVVAQPERQRVSTSYKTAEAPGVDTTMSTSFVTTFLGTISVLELMSTVRGSIKQKLIM